MLQSNQKIIRHKVGLLNLTEELGNVSKACQMMGLLRDTFYRYRNAVEEGGVEALLGKPRRGPNLKNRVDSETENAVVDYAVEYPAYGQVRVSNELRKLGVFVSASGVRSIWMRHDLANFKKRLKALETKVKSPQTNGICERFHKTILQEFYQVTFRKNIYEDIDQLQNDLDLWIDHYNNERTHQGKVCEGRMPMQTMEDGKQIWKEKFVDQT